MKFWKVVVFTLITFAFVTCDNGNGTSDLCKDGHAWGEYTQTTPPTCTEAGIKTRACTRAGCSAVDTVTQEGEPALGHDWEEATFTTDPTCEGDGIGTASCTRCDAEVADDVIPDTALGHLFESYVSDGNATCTADGTKTAVCEHGCGAEDTVTDEGSLDPIAHFFTTYTFENNATCTEDGTKTAECDHGCGETDTITDKGSLDPSAHSFTTYISDNNATCTADGTKTAECDHGCSETDTIADEGSALGHNFIVFISTTATCTVTGEDTYKCSRCEETDEQNISALGHEFGDIGSECIRCDYELYTRFSTGPGGGIIFYVSRDGFVMTDTGEKVHHLEAAPNDFEERCHWSSILFPTPAPNIPTESGIGTGRSNTALILDLDPLVVTGYGSIAAEVCYNYENNGKKDWFLPSIAELEQLYFARFEVANLQTTLDLVDYKHNYWSSSQSLGVNGWLIDYAQRINFSADTSGWRSDTIKSTLLSVRAIRAF